uniref:Uncharacterized protein n=1 Tax=Physcomitrium patens TaxID=3218 RepID=A0A2K1J6X7_PHYPA|nr:hypothetical protein PHYPA_020385 [Physcomitrium patens]
MWSAESLWTEIMTIGVVSICQLGYRRGCPSAELGHRCREGVVPLSLAVESSISSHSSDLACVGRWTQSHQSLGGHFGGVIAMFFLSTRFTGEHMEETLGGDSFTVYKRVIMSLSHRPWSLLVTLLLYIIQSYFMVHILSNVFMG